MERKKQKLGRPLKGSSRRVPTTVYLPLDMLNELEDIEGSRSDYIVDAIKSKMEEESDNDQD